MRSFLSCLVLFLFSFSAQSQNVKIAIGASEIAVNQVFTITVTLENERLRNYSSFPEIDGFSKQGTSSSTSTSFVNGRMSSSQSITQNYSPTKEGTFQIPPFNINVNEQSYIFAGAVVKVGPPLQQQRSRDPFNFFNNRRKSQQPQEYIDVEAKAFLALTNDKSEVYVGEEFTTTLAFYVSESNRADMRFYDLGKQITEIVKNLKPNNCWEENFNIDNINGQPVTIRGKEYTQYKIFQATYYPLNLEDVSFPEISLKLIKYRVAKNPSFFGRNRQEDFETFYSMPKTVTVKELPSHPLKESVAVGQYVLREKMSKEELQTGQSFNYSFNILGRGNISAINPPQIPRNKDFDFYEPNIRQDIKRAENVVSGAKVFAYYGIPNEPGQYDLGDYLAWIYFDPEREVYDTLRSQYTVLVTGESRKNEYISSNDLGSFYDRIDFENNDLVSLERSSWIRVFSNFFVLAMFAASAFLIFKK